MSSSNTVVFIRRKVEGLRQVRMTAEEKLELAEEHLIRVQDAWDDPVDWGNLTLYGFYCLEAAVEAAALAIGLSYSKTHVDKSRVSKQLYEDHGFPDVEDLLRDLNDARKATAYGDVAAPELDSEQLAAAIEDYVDRVAALLRESED